MRRAYILASGIVLVLFGIYFVNTLYPEIKEVYKAEWGYGELAEYYTTLLQLYKASDVVVVGTVVTDPWYERAEKINVYFKTKFRVEKVLKGKCGREIIISDTGTYIPKAGKAYRDGADLWKKGEKYILFLRTDGKRYVPTGSWQGEFKIINGRVYSRNVLGEAEPVGLKVKDMPFSEFVAEMKK